MSKMGTSVPCQCLLPTRNLQCSCQNPQHSTQWEGTRTSLWQTCYLETCVQRGHPPRVCAVSQEGRLSSTGQTVPLEGDEWKSCTNKRSNRPLACWPEGKGLVTPLLEKD